MAHTHSFMNLQKYFKDKCSDLGVVQQNKYGIGRSFNKIALVDYLYICDNYDEFVFDTKGKTQQKSINNFLRQLHNNYDNYDIYVYGFFGLYTTIIKHKVVNILVHHIDIYDCFDKPIEKVLLDFAYTNMCNITYDTYDKSIRIDMNSKKCSIL